VGRHKLDCKCENCIKNHSGEVNEMVKPANNLDTQLKQLESDFGLKKANTIKIDPKIRTKIYALNYVLDGGIAQCEGGHKICLQGKESSGKSTLALNIIANFQALDKRCVWINAENNFDPQWAEINGVDTDRLRIAKPDTLEKAGDLLISLIPKVDLIVIDSVVSLIPRSELEGSLEDKHYAGQAQVYAPLCRKINEEYKDYKTVIIFINQVREKVGLVFGNPETTPCGKALKHLYDSVIEVRMGQSIEESVEGETEEKKKKDKIKIGNEVVLVNRKNKKGVPFRTVVVDFYYNGVYDNKKSLLYAGMKYGFIKLDGRTYTYKDLKAVGKDAFMELLTEPILKEIEELIWTVQK